MQKLKIKLKNCYGIQELEYEFDFTNTRVYSLYAPNGCMKTSFSKTFSDLSMSKTSSDLIFTDRTSERVIQDEGGNEIKGENIFAVQSYDKDFNSDKTSLLLVNQVIKQKYDNALLKIETKKSALMRALRELSGLNGRAITPESELIQCFDKKSIFELFESIEQDVNNNLDEELEKIVYSEVFNEKTLPFLESGEIKSQLKGYIDKYNDLVDKSPILSKNFNHQHAKNVHKSLSDNGFFSVNHSVSLFDGKDKEEITSSEDFHKRIDEEKQKILSDRDLLREFNEIDKKLTNVELKKFRDYLIENKYILPALSNYKELQQNIWVSYLANQHVLFSELLNEYKNSKGIIFEAINEAKRERTEWTEVVALFNKRFLVPFTMEVSNQDDVILKGSSPHVSFRFFDHEESREIDQNALLKVISQGEKRALYILNILFELNIRKKQATKTIVVIDDIADSFDYKNKYAIIECLKEISELNNFYLISLTHNFDFHRTISGRLNIPRQNRLCTVKNTTSLNLIQEKYQNNPFIYWKNNLGTSRFALCAIPFVRNITEYCGLENDFLKLTSLLHIKPDTCSIKIQDLEVIYKSILKDKPNLVLENQERFVIDIMFEIADEILEECSSTAELESKVILSIAIRLNAEKFMIDKIQNQTLIESITKNQTTELLKHFKQIFPNQTSKHNLLDQVNLMTPENIHLNSFMYEPILDMSADHLKELYKELKQIDM